MHQRESVHHHLKDVVGIRTIVLHPMLEQRAQQVCVLGEEFEIGLGQPVELANGVLRRNLAKPHRQRLTVSRFTVRITPSKSPNSL